MKVDARDLALGWLTVGGGDPFQWLAAAEAGGFGSMGIKVAPRLQEAAPVLLGDAQARLRFQARCRELGIGILNMGSIWLDGSTPPAAYCAALDIGAQLGARYVVGISVDPEPTRRTESLIELARLAQERGLRTTIEFFAYSQVPTLEAACEIARQADGLDVGVLFDALHFHRSGGVVSHLTPEAVSKIDYLQLCDAPQVLPSGMTLSEEGRTARLFPGEGDIPLRPMRAALPASIQIEVEIPHLGLQGLSPEERGRVAMERSLSFLNT